MDDCIKKLEFNKKYQTSQRSTKKIFCYKRVSKHRDTLTMKVTWVVLKSPDNDLF